MIGGLRSCKSVTGSASAYLNIQLQCTQDESRSEIQSHSAPLCASYHKAGADLELPSRQEGMKRAAVTGTFIARLFKCRPSPL